MPFDLVAERIATYLRASVTDQELGAMSIRYREGAETRPRAGIPRLKPGYAPFLSYGFRPFFLGAGAWACAAMVLWTGLMSGGWSIANGFGAVAWHAHEFLFGYVSAVMCGFLLTAIPNWTGQLPIQGGRLLALFVLWLIGRLAMLGVDFIGVPTAAVLDGLFLFTLAAVILREIVTGRNWRNLKIVALVAVFAFANLAFHVEVLLSGAAESAIRAALAVVVGLIMLVGGRITPSFTRNWLSRQGEGRLPAPLDRFDMAAIGVAAAAFIVWIIAPQSWAAGILLLAAAAAQAARLARWAGERTWREPLVFILHLGYAFVPLGALILGLSILVGGLPQSGALHAWTTGAIGVMTLAVMTRATLGHTGRDLRATAPTLIIFGAVLAAAAARIAAPLVPSVYLELLIVAAVGWIVAFGTFVLVYGPMLVRAKQT